MSRGVLGKNNWALVLLILVGVVLGGLIGKLCAGVPALSWLSYGQSFGFVNPMVLDLGILVLTFGFTVDITVAGILGIVIAITGLTVGIISIVNGALLLKRKSEIEF